MSPRKLFALATLLLCTPALAYDPPTPTGRGVLTAPTPAAGRVILGAAASGANTDITSIAPVTLTVTGSLKLPFCAGYLLGNSGAGVSCSASIPVGSVSGAAPINSPALTGTPGAPTAPPLTNNTQLASTAYADAAVAAEAAARAAAGYAPMASPVLSGNPTTPTRSPGDVSTKIASDAFAMAAAAAGPNLVLPGGMHAGSWFGPASASFTNTAIPTASRLAVFPIYVPNAAGVTLKKLGFYIGTASSSSFNVRLYLFGDTGSGAPGSMVADSGSQPVAASTSGNITYTLASTVALPQGWYWAGLVVDATGASAYSIASGSSLLASTIIGSGTPGGALGYSAGAVLGVYKASTVSVGETAFGTPTTTGGTVVPAIALGL